MINFGWDVKITDQTKKDLYISAKFTWYLYSIASIVGFIALVANEALFAKISGAFKINHIGEEACLFCGVTRALISISHGDFNEAFAFSRHSAWICLLFVVNTVIFANNLKNLVKIGKFSK